MKPLNLAVTLTAVALALSACHRVKVRDMDGKLLKIKGSYALTCRQVVEGDDGALSAQCLDAQHQFRAASLQTTTCKGDISNSNGVLSCAH